MITSLNVGNQLSATLSRKTEKRTVVIPQMIPRLTVIGPLEPAWGMLKNAQNEQFVYYFC